LPLKGWRIKYLKWLIIVSKTNSYTTLQKPKKLIIATMSHDIRNPLTALQSIINMEEQDVIRALEQRLHGFSPLVITKLLAKV
jgi:signal transduction histidine kinase